MGGEATRVGGKGERVVDEVLQSVEALLGGTNDFLKKVALVESQ